MSKCPLCYNEIEQNSCQTCGLNMTEAEMTQLKADTYDSIINHLMQSSNDDRRREQIRTKIALKNIKKWAKGNLPVKLMEDDISDVVETTDQEEKSLKFK